jgi:hypothetical protein
MVAFSPLQVRDISTAQFPPFPGHLFSRHSILCCQQASHPVRERISHPYLEMSPESRMTRDRLSDCAGRSVPIQNTGNSGFLPHATAKSTVPTVFSPDSALESFPESCSNGGRQPHHPDSATVEPGKRPRKRPHGSGRNYAPRKRAITACEFCRLRKTRCDNARPTCGFCQLHQAECIYPDAVDDALYDPTTRELLGRLDEIKELLRHCQHGQPPSQTTSSATRPHDPDGPQLPVADGFTTEEESHTSQTGRAPAGEPTQNQLSSDHYASCQEHLLCESILRWPVLHEFLSPDKQLIHSFLLDSVIDSESGRSPDQSADGSEHRPGQRGVSESDLVPLCRKFLSVVHVKNPILDTQNLLRYARIAAEDGLAWDAPSCLVVCLALGAIENADYTNGL